MTTSLSSLFLVTLMFVLGPCEAATACNFLQRIIAPCTAHSGRTFLVLKGGGELNMSQTRRWMDPCMFKANVWVVLSLCSDSLTHAECLQLQKDKPKKCKFFSQCLLKCGWCLVFFQGLYSILLVLRTYLTSQPCIKEYLNDLRTNMYCHIAFLSFKGFETHGANVTGWPPNAIKGIEMKNLFMYFPPLWAGLVFLSCLLMRAVISSREHGAWRFKSSCNSERSFSVVQQRISGVWINN